MTPLESNPIQWRCLVCRTVNEDRPCCNKCRYCGSPKGTPRLGVASDHGDAEVWREGFVMTTLESASRLWSQRGLWRQSHPAAARTKRGIRIIHHMLGGAQVRDELREVRPGEAAVVSALHRAGADWWATVESEMFERARSGRYSE